MCSVACKVQYAGGGREGGGASSHSAAEAVANHSTGPGRWPQAQQVAREGEHATPACLGRVCAMRLGLGLRGSAPTASRSNEWMGWANTSSNEMRTNGCPSSGVCACGQSGPNPAVGSQSTALSHHHGRTVRGAAAVHACTQPPLMQHHTATCGDVCTY